MHAVVETVPRVDERVNVFLSTGTGIGKPIVVVADSYSSPYLTSVLLIEFGCLSFVSTEFALMDE